MRSNWERLRSDLLQAACCLQASQEFRSMRDLLPIFQDFSDPCSLAAYLHKASGDLDHKDEVLRTLVECVQAEVWADTASITLWLSLWPGLDAIYQRRRSAFSASADDLTSLISEEFTRQVAYLDLGSVRRVAATLIRNIDRNVLRAWHRSRPREVLWNDERSARCTGQADVSTVNEPSRPPSASPDVISAWLDAVIGRDAQFVAAIAVMELTKNEAATQFGLEPATARKRYQRALERLREEIANHVSHRAFQTGV
jgi:RNA polymerase sigma-70 factor (ECF subfamily)